MSITYTVSKFAGKWKFDMDELGGFDPMASYHETQKIRLLSGISRWRKLARNGTTRAARDMAKKAAREEKAKLVALILANS